MRADAAALEKAETVKAAQQALHMLSDWPLP